MSIGAFYNSRMRTPEERFADLPGFAFGPHYLEWRGLRAHYLDEGRGRRATYLCLHGKPTWSYLYRRMIPVFVAAGARVVAPDFIGFGRSDKPAGRGAYTFDFHRQFLLDLIEQLDLRDVVLVVQDWGGLLGLTLPMEMPERFARLLVMNTTLATGDAPLSQGFVAWRDVREPATRTSTCGKLLARACPQLSAAEAAAYDAPFPGRRLEGRRAPLPEPGARAARRSGRRAVAPRPATGCAAAGRARPSWRSARRTRCSACR